MTQTISHIFLVVCVAMGLSPPFFGWGNKDGARQLRLGAL